MNRSKRRVASLLGVSALSLSLLVPRPAHAQASYPAGWGHWDPAGPIAVGVGGLVYIVGGTATFIALDLTRQSSEGRLPNGIGIAQVTYASTLVGVGALLLSDAPAAGAPLLAMGIGLAAFPIVDWSTRRPAQRMRAALRLTPTSVSISGKF